MALSYNDEAVSVTWKDSLIRNWLNEIFYNDAFTDEERQEIGVTVTDENVEDRVFLLSTDEAEEYFKDNESRVSCPTIFAINSGITTGEDEGCWWWLRTSGAEDNYAAVVDESGAINTDGVNVDGIGGVRPAMWWIY